MPDSVISERSGLLSKTEKVGLIARAAVIFGVEEFNIYHDDLHGSHEDLELFYSLLQYLLTPPYLRKAAMPLKEEFKYVGMLPPLNIPSHIISKNEDLRFGYVLVKGEKFYVETGLEEPIELKSRENIAKGNIIPIKLYKEKGKVYAIKHPFPDYSGFEIVKFYNVKQALDKAMDSNGAIIFTSREGKPISSEWENLKKEFKEKRRYEIFFGSPKRGLEEILEDKYKNIGYWLNMIEGQKVRTVRTEEAMFICLGQLNTLIRQINIA
ncbi:MAG: putative RNA uridine N3 methyltransferase [Nitrososphaeria archaeon]